MVASARMAKPRGAGRGPAPAGEIDMDAAAYNALPMVEQKVLRRTMRMGRAQGSPEEARMAVALARFQRAQPWYRLFWLLFLPGLVLSVVIASRLHVALVGVVLALAAQGAWGWVSLRRVEKVNRHLL